MSAIALATILLILAFALLLLDLFLPSSGMLILAGCLSACGSLLFAFRDSFNTGLTFSILVLASIPVVLTIFIKVWPHTRIGKKMIGELPEKQDFHWADAHQVPDATQLVGAIGRTVVEMMPAGEVEIEGKHFDSISEGQLIEKGKTVRVLKVDMGRLVVVEWEDAGANSEATGKLESGTSRTSSPSKAPPPTAKSTDPPACFPKVHFSTSQSKTLGWNPFPRTTSPSNPNGQSSHNLDGQPTRHTPTGLGPLIRIC